ncbi:PcfJ domain-containing protein [Vibrio parahaemolyticus]|nr:PcfJ domain-containing protein [Vibrio parahaemolyticus]
MISELDNNWSHHTFSYYSLMKRREILSKITGQQCTGKHIKFLKKLDVLNGSEEEITIIKKSLQSDTVVDSFKHREQINPLELYLVHTYPFLKGSGLLPKLSNTKCNYFAEVKVGIAELLKVYQDTIELGNALDFKNSKMLVAACETTEQLESLHSKWIRQLNKSHTYLTDDISFEPFPVRSDKQFQFISSVNQLIQEGREMKHCVATYREKALNKTSYIFRVTSPNEQLWS